MILGGPIATLMLPAVFPASHFNTESQSKRGAGDGESYLGVRPVVDNLKLPGPRCVKRHVQLGGTWCAGKRCAGGWPADPQCSVLNRRDHAVPFQRCHGQSPLEIIPSRGGWRWMFDTVARQQVHEEQRDRSNRISWRGCTEGGSSGPPGPSGPSAPSNPSGPPGCAGRRW